MPSKKALLLTILAFASTAPAQSKPACDTPAHHAFDFWLGDWDVKNAKGDTAGSSHIERILDGCVIFETGLVRIRGKSFNTFDPKTRSGRNIGRHGGAPAEMVGHSKEEPRLRPRTIRRDGKPAKSRMTFLISENDIRQLVDNRPTTARRGRRRLTCSIRGRSKRLCQPLELDFRERSRRETVKSSSRESRSGASRNFRRNQTATATRFP
jgi:hypothetical protein